MANTYPTTKADFRTFGAAIAAAAQAEAKKWGVTLEYAGGTLGSELDPAVLKLRMRSGVSRAELLNNEQAAWNAMCETYNIHPAMYGKTVEFRRTAYRVVSYNPGAPKYCIGVVNFRTGKRMRAPLQQTINGLADVSKADMKAIREKAGLTQSGMARRSEADLELEMMGLGAMKREQQHEASDKLACARLAKMKTKKMAASVSLTKTAAAFTKLAKAWPDYGVSPTWYNAVLCNGAQVIGLDADADDEFWIAVALMGGEFRMVNAAYIEAGLVD